MFTTARGSLPSQPIWIVAPIPKKTTYRRQSIFWQMRIATPIPKNPTGKKKITKKKLFFGTAILHPLWEEVFKSEKTFHYFSSRIPKIKKKFGHWTLGSGGKKTFEHNEETKKIRKKLFCNAEVLHPLWAKVFKCETTYFQYFSQRIQKSKKFGHWTLGSGGKKTVKRSEKRWYQKILLRKAKLEEKNN